MIMMMQNTRGWDIENLFGEFNNEDYYEPIKTKDAFNNNYIEYESRGD